MAKFVKKKKLRKSSDLSKIESIIKNFETLASIELLEDCSLSLPINGGLSIDYYGPGATMPDEFFYKSVRIFYASYFSIRLEFGYGDEVCFTKNASEDYALSPGVAQMIVNFLEKGEYGNDTITR